MNYYNEIKNELINNEATKRAKDYSKNKGDLITYYKVGKLLSEADGHYGEGIIKEYSKRLTSELGKGYSKRNLWLMLKFYLMSEKMQALPTQLTWSHYCELLPIDDINEIEYYIKISIEQKISYRELHSRIKNKEYERLDDKTKNKLIKKEKTTLTDFVKNPILIKNSYNYTEISEKVLQKLILEDLSSFLKELGTGFCYVDNEYKIKLGNTYNYIDLLLFNYEYNAFVVIELKVTPLKKQYIGQIEIYMNYIDKNIKSLNQNKTIGIIICKRGSTFIMEYCSDDRILSREYQLM